jgi:hypothetical protein
MRTEETPKKKKAEEKICADCRLREFATSLCLCFGREGALKVRRTDLACNYFQSKKMTCLLIVGCVLGFLRLAFPNLLNFSGG